MDNEKKSAQYDSRYMASRISRAIGHIKLVRSMVVNGAECTEVLIQLAAVRGQLDSICSSLMAQYAEQFAENTAKPGIWR